MSSHCRDGLTPRSITCSGKELREIRTRLAESGRLAVSHDEIEQLLDVARVRANDGGYVPELTYEAGIAAALAWVLGEGEMPID